MSRDLAVRDPMRRQELMDLRRALLHAVDRIERELEIGKYAPSEGSLAPRNGRGKVVNGASLPVWTGRH